MFKRKMTLVLSILTLMLPCLVIQQAHSLEPITVEKTETTVFKNMEPVQVADNVVIIYDASSSMADPYQQTGMTKILAEKKLLRQRAERMPDVDFNVGLYTFSGGYTTFYEMQPFNKDKFLAAVDRLPEVAGGPTMLENTLRGLDKLLQTLSGRTVVFLFTDGTYTSFGRAVSKPVEHAKAMAEKYDVGFYLISTANTEKEEKMLEAVASINETSRVIPFDILMDYPEYYTGAVFVIEESYVVLKQTQEQVVGFKIDNVLFDFDKATLKNDYKTDVDEIGQLLVDNPDSTLVVAGFTDSTGDKEYNLGLSRRRVEALANYLGQKFQVDKKRMVLHWYGEAAPAADNTSAEGRQQNRRAVVFVAGVQ